VLPIGKVAGASLVIEAIEQLSSTVGVPRTTPLAVHSSVSVFTETGAGQTIVGSWISVTVTICSQVAMFPLPSVTVQVTVVLPIGKIAGASLVIEAIEQLSSTVGVPRTTPLAVHSSASVFTETGAGQTIVGSWMSVTVTICSQVAMFPLPSVTVQVTVVLPSGKIAGASLVIEAIEQLSSTVGVPRTTPLAVHSSASVFTETGAGQTIVGSSISVTVTICSQVAIFPLPSVTVQVTVVLPIGKTAGASLVTDAIEQLSSTVGVPRTTPLAVHSSASVFTATGAGQTIVGSSISVTVTICSQVAMFPLPSVTVQVTVVLPSGKTAGASFVTEAIEQLSSTVGVPRTTPLAVHSSASVFTATGAGQTIVGSSISVTVTICSQVAMFPLPSVTVQVTVVLPSGNTAGASLVTEAIEQLSSTVGVPRTTPLAVHSSASVFTATGAGQTIVGSSTSVTVTICSQVAMFPLPSVTVQVTVVLPSGNTAGASLVTEAIEQLSSTVGVPRTTPLAVHSSASVFTATGAGQTIVGSSTSVTVTICSQVAMFPLPSVTVQVTVVLPSGKTAGASLVTEAIEQLSSTVGVPRTTPLAVHSSASVLTATGAGHTIVGSSISVTVTICSQVAMFPLPSVTVQVTVVLPSGNTAGASFVTEAIEQLSSTVGVPRTTPLAVHSSASVFTATGAGQTIVGSSISVTVTICSQVAMFPLPSVTVQVTVVLPSGNTAGASFVTDAIEQLSSTVGVPRTTPLAVHSSASVFTATGAGQTIVGSSTSVTVTICSQVAMFPLPSVTVQVTVVLPSGKTAGASLVTDAIEQLSSTVGVPRTTPLAVHSSASVFTATGAGQTIVGSSISVTVTICSQVAMFPLPSVTVQVTVVLPSGNTAGASLVTEAIEQLSSTVGVPRTTPLAVHSSASVFTATGAGQTIVGSSISVTVTICSQVAMFPLPSVTVQVTVVLPSGKTAGASFVTEAIEQLSSTVGVPRTTPLAVHSSASVFTATGAGQTIVGSSISVTVTICSQVAIFPLPSVTVQVTVVLPIGNTAGASFVTEAIEQLSSTVGVPRTTPLAVHSSASVLNCYWSRQTIVGSSMSVTVTICSQVDWEYCWSIVCYRCN
jgi:hypothetical protein